MHKAYRQQGIAGKVLLHLIEAVKQKPIHTIIAGIDINNIASISLHQKLFFAETGTFKQVGYKFNNRLDLKLCS